MNLSEDFDALVTDVQDSGLLVSLCTITAPPTDASGEDAIGPSGAPFGDFVPVEGLEDLPCMASPLIQWARGTETMSADEIRSQADLHVFIAGYYPEIQSAYRALITKREGDDPVEYYILNVETDSQSRTTRLVLQRRSI